MVHYTVDFNITDEFVCLYSFIINSPMTADVLFHQPALRSSNVDINELGVKAIFLTEAEVVATDHDVGVAFQWSCFRKDLNKQTKKHQTLSVHIVHLFCHPIIKLAFIRNPTAFMLMHSSRDFFVFPDLMNI